MSTFQQFHKKQFFFQLLIISFLTSPLYTLAQSFSRLNLPITINNVVLKNATAGGMNDPQYSIIDLNGDGKLDLYVFDRIGEMHLPFLNQGDVGSVDYRYAPQFADRFPNCRSWVLLRDYDKDGITDLFTSSFEDGVFGIRVYKGKYQGGKIAFTRLNFDGFLFNVLTYPQSTGQKKEIFVPLQDYPHIDDIDGDGDLDILSFNQEGSYIHYYENFSVELGHGKDSLIYELSDECWGKVFEPFAVTELKLSPNPDECATPLWVPSDTLGNPNIHPGSTLLAFDQDGDSDKDLLVGDINLNSFLSLTNAGSLANAWMNEQATTYPSNDIPVDIPFFPAPFLLDIDGDGLKDFVAAPNSLTPTLDTDVTWFYKNMGSNSTPDFELQQKDFLAETMVDFGTGAHPALVDVNADGLLDLVVGNQRHIPELGVVEAQLFLLENIGSASSPAFELTDDNWLNFKQFNGTSVDYAPAFGDMDSDGDLDLVVGNQLGWLFYAENTAGAGNPMVFGSILPGWHGIMVGESCTPQIADLNRDGLSDLIIGEQQGNFNYFQNIGTPTVSAFNTNPTEAPNNGFLGFMNTSQPGAIIGTSASWIIDLGTDFKIITGSEKGFLNIYENVEDNLDGTFTLALQNWKNLREGFRTKPTLGDLNGDGYFDLIVGNARGGLSTFSTNMSLDGLVSSHEVETVFEVQVFPNPVASILIVSLQNMPLGKTKLTVFDGMGRVIQNDLFLGNSFEINTDAWKTGIYFLEISNEWGSLVRKVVK